MTEVAPQSVAVQLLGGLGNQLFQASAGYALAKRQDAHLVLDTSRLGRAGGPDYQLAPFHLGASELNTSKSGLIARLAGKLKNRRRSDHRHVPLVWQGHVYSEPHFHFDATVLGLKAPAYLKGYFQSPRYFDECADELRKIFDMTPIVSDEAKRLAGSLPGSQSVSVHVRRGDIEADPKMAKVHGTLANLYYDKAVERIRKTVAGAAFFVFSDDPAAARTIADRVGGQGMRGTSARDDLWLMSQCHHHIIANSSFSWWAAYLGRQGITIAPQHWFAGGNMEGAILDDLFPQHWLVING